MISGTGIDVCTHSIDYLLPHAQLHYEATGSKCCLICNMQTSYSYCNAPRVLHYNYSASFIPLCANYSHLLEFFHVSTVFDSFSKSLNPSVSNAIFSKTTCTPQERNNFEAMQWMHDIYLYCIQEKTYLSLFISAQCLRFATRTRTPISPLPMLFP